MGKHIFVVIDRNHEEVDSLYLADSAEAVFNDIVEEMQEENPEDYAGWASEELEQEAKVRYDINEVSLWDMENRAHVRFNADGTVWRQKVDPEGGEDI